MKINNRKINIMFIFSLALLLIGATRFILYDKPYIFMIAIGMIILQGVLYPDWFKTKSSGG